MKQKAKKYPFLDLVIDVFYSIILYNAFTAFPGFKLEAGLMAVAIFVMINYWWGSRSFLELPKHYIVDFYMITIVMFIFAQWANYFTDVTGFLYVFAVFFAFEAVYSTIDIFAHKEKKDEPSLKFYIIIDSLCAAAYLLEALFIKELTWISLVLIVVPYLIFLGLCIKKKLFRPVFVSID